MPTRSHPPLIRALLAGAAYPHRVGAVCLLETHISWVILTGPFAYKIKKPVRLEFADFSTLQRRRFFCEEELRLNRRLAPDLYLGVTAIYGKPHAPSFEPEGDPIEYAVRMRQFEQEQLLGHVLDRGQLDASHIDNLIDQVNAFHKTIERAPAESPYATPALIEQQALDNFPPLLTGTRIGEENGRVSKLRSWFIDAFTAHRATFDARRHEGRVRECHGDMHLGNMFLEGGRVVVFDGIDFNAELRWIDLASEVAFLAMDLEDRGAPAFAHRFLNGYLEQSGDYGMLPVLPFYLAYRALVRAKVAAIRLGQDAQTEEETTGLREEIAGYLKQAEDYTGRTRPRLIITHGLSGSGKTHGTQGLLEAAGAIRLRSDVERKRLHGLGPLERSEDHPELDIYSAEATRRTYNRLLGLAGEALRAGFTTIVDATFLKQTEREAFRRLALKQGTPFTILAFRASRETLRRRLLARARKGRDASEAGLAVLDKQIQFAEPLLEAERKTTIVVGPEGVPPGTELWPHIQRMSTGGAADPD